MAEAAERVTSLLDDAFPIWPVSTAGNGVDARPGRA
jgi:hypothetical protein